MWRLLVFHRLTEAGHTGAQSYELLLQHGDGLLLLEDHLVQLGELPLEVGVADFQVDDARVHGFASSSMASHWRANREFEHRAGS